MQSIILNHEIVYGVMFQLEKGDEAIINDFTTFIVDGEKYAVIEITSVGENYIYAKAYKV